MTLKNLTLQKGKKFFILFLKKSEIFIKMVENLKFYNHKPAYYFFLISILFSLSSLSLKASLNMDDDEKETVYKKVKSVLDKHLEDNTDLLNSSKNKDIVVFLGATGAGKSTLINYLSNKELKITKHEKLELQDPNDSSAMKIGHKTVSQTRLPQFIESGSLILYDLPGFDDTGGTAINLVNASFIKHILENSKTSRLVFVTGQDQITANRGESFKNLIKVTSNLLPNTDAIEKSSLWVVTKSVTKDSDELIDYLNETIEEEEKKKISIWLTNSKKISPMSRKIDDSQKNDILKKIVEIDSSKIKNINIEAIYNKDVRSDLKEIFSLEMDSFLENTLKKSVKNHSNINDINQAKLYFSASFEKDIFSELESSPLINLLKPLSEKIFSEEQGKLFNKIKQEKALNITLLDLKKEQLEREEEKKRVKELEEQIKREQAKIEEQNRLLQLQAQETQKQMDKQNNLLQEQNNLLKAQLAESEKAKKNENLNFDPIPSKYYKIKNRSNGNLLCAWNAEANRKGTAGMWQDNVDTTNLHWCFIKNDSYYKIKNQTAGNLLCAWNFETDKGSAGMWQDNVDTPNLHWYFKKEADYYKIKSRNGSSNVLCSWGAETNVAGTVSMAADIDGNTLEHWYFIPID